VAATKADEYRGWLYKWTNYINGYQKRWFVLQNGLLSYYRTQAEMAHTCRGTINLENAFIHTEDSCNFVVSNGGTQRFHLKASSEVERQKWVTALELAKARAIRVIDSDEDKDEIVSPADKNELVNMVRTLQAKMEDLNTCNDLITKHGAALQRSLSELEQLDSGQEAVSRIRSVNERATLFRITSNAMINACADFLDLAQTQGGKWQRLLQYEHDQRLRLEEMVETLAKQHSSLERQARKNAAAAPPQPIPSNPSLLAAPSATGPAKKLSKSSNSVEMTVDEAGHSGGSTAGPQSPPSAVAVETPVVAAPVLPSASNSNAASEDDDDEFFDVLEEAEEFNVPLRPGPTASQRADSAASSASIAIPVDSVDDNDVSSTESDLEDPHKDGRLVVTVRTKTSKKAAATASPTPDADMSQLNALRRKEFLESSGDPAPVSRLARKRRTAIPPKPNYPLNLWSIMKNCIGKDLSKIPMPVNFSEPLSMLQRLTEDIEYSEILDQAATMKNSQEQLACVAAFTASSYATTTVRTTKPFNPLLGETYELDRTDDKGWKLVTEQVSHHPPMAAQHVESDKWEMWQEFSMSSKFRGKYLQIIPLGVTHLRFKDSGNHYTWRKVTTTVHNIIVGKLWVDQSGEMDITNHLTKDNCHLKYYAYSYFSREIPRKVTGVVTDESGREHYVVRGTWDDHIEVAPVVNHSQNDGKREIETGKWTRIWNRNFSESGNENMYSLSKFAIELNEEENDVAPSDTRRRPDQRLMEEAAWDEANDEKVRLEEKQRQKRRKREAEAEEAKARGELLDNHHRPVWFRKEQDSVTGALIYKYSGGYWEAKRTQNWTMCPDLYSKDEEE